MTIARPAPVVDVAIIGAGPSGLACAIAAARQGLHVEVIDAIRPSIDKACGEGLMPDSLAALAALGLDLNHHLHQDHTRNAETALLRGIRFLSDKSTNEAAFPANPGRGIRRTVLHQLLLDHATSLGVRFHFETVVQRITQHRNATKIHTNHQSLRARYLIGADGHNSRVAKWAGLERSTTHSSRIGLRQHYTIAPWTDFVEVYWSTHGQAYVTPTSSHQVCVAFISNRKHASPAEALTHFPALQQRLAAAQPNGASRGAVTLHRTLQRVTRGNIALIGDASGSIDAITGEGLALCFRQAAALSLALKSNDLDSYQQAHHRIQRFPRLMSQSLLLMDGYPLLRARVLATFERNPRLFAALLQSYIGHSPLHLFGAEGLLATGLHILTS